MRGRNGPGEPSFGSDSFLDIVANLVGILIVLIMLAGLQAGRAPVSDAELVAAGHAPSPSVGNAPQNDNDNQRPRSKSALDNDELTIPKPSAPSEPTADEIAQRVAEARLEMESRQRRLGTVDVDSQSAQLRSLQSELADQSTRISRLQTALASRQKDARTTELQLKDFDADYALLRQRLIDANDELKSVVHAAPRTEDLELRINPIGRRGSGKELAFRLDRHQVVYMPIEDLVDQISSREMYSSTALLKGEAQRGVAGPIGGVELTYQLKIAATGDGFGAVSVRPLLTGIIHIRRDAPSQPIDEAVAEGGLVMRTLLVFPPDSVVRLFVSTDSFAEARKISAVARDLGMGVDVQIIDPGADIPVMFGRSNAVVQ